VSDDEQWKRVIDQSDTKLVVVDVHQDWCGLCEAIHPTFLRIFQEYDDASRSIEELNSKNVDGGTQPLQVRFAKEKNTTEQSLAALTAYGNSPSPGVFTTLYSPFMSTTTGYENYVTTTTTDTSTYPYVYADPTQSSTLGTQYGYYPVTGQLGAQNPTYGLPTTTTGYDYNSVAGYGTPQTPYYQYGYPTTDFTGLASNGFSYQYPGFGLEGEVGPAPPPGPISLFVLHIPSNFKDDDLHNIFKDCGNTLSAKVMTDSNGQSRGFGFVNYATYAEAHQAITQFDGYHVPNTNKYLKVSFKTTPKPKETAPKEKLSFD